MAGKVILPVAVYPSWITQMESSFPLRHPPLDVISTKRHAPVPKVASIVLWDRQPYEGIVYTIVQLLLLYASGLLGTACWVRTHQTAGEAIDEYH